MGGRSLEAIDADLVLVEHELGLAKPYQQQCPDTYAALEQRRDELEQEADEGKLIDTLKSGASVQDKDAACKRLKEIGTARAMGVRRSGIRRLFVIEGIRDVGYAEIVEIVAPDGQERIGQVLEVTENMAVVQVFSGTK